MIVGCGEWGFRELPLADHFEIAARLGFRYLEFGIGGGQVGRLPEAPSASDVAALRKLSVDHGVEAPFCCIENDFTLPDGQGHAATVARVVDQIRVAADCGATHVRLFAGFTASAAMTEPLWTQMFDAFSICDALCEELGLVIAIETHGAISFNDDGSANHVGTPTTDPDGLRRMMRELPPRVGFNYDPGNIKAARPDDKSYGLEIIDSRINYCHLKDWTRRGDGWVAVAIGEDDMDYASLLASMSFDGVYLIEYEPTADVEDGIRRSLAHLGQVAPGYRLA